MLYFSKADDFDCVYIVFDFINVRLVGARDKESLIISECLFD